MLRSIGVVAICLFCCCNGYSQDTSPASFSGFVTRSDNQNVYLFWNIPDSSKLEYFIAEKSNNGVLWTALDSIVYDGTYYLYIDRSPSVGLNYYRIRGEGNGRTAYSISRRAYVNQIDNPIPIYPNPVDKNLNFQMTALTKGRYQAVVYNSGGVRIAGQVIYMYTISESCLVQISSYK